VMVGFFAFCLLMVFFCLRCTTTVGTSPTAGAGVSVVGAGVLGAGVLGAGVLGTGVLGCGVLVVDVFAGCSAVPEAPAAWVDDVGVVTGVVEASPGAGELAGASAASAPPARGPPRPARPPPATADSIARHAQPRERVIGYLHPSWSLCNSSHS
jgi:hypothetical protein